MTFNGRLHFGAQAPLTTETPKAMENENTSDPVVEDASDADFDAGFKGDATETPATPPPVETPPVEAAPVPPPEPEPEYVQLTKQDHEKLLAAFSKIEEIGALSKKVDSALGHVGALKQMVQRAQGETPAGQAVQLDEADFAELREQYPEFASLTIKGMNQALAKLKGNDPQAIEKVAGDLRGQIAESSLEAVFPGWKDDVNTPSFGEWLKGQPQDMQARASSDKVGDAATMLRAFYKSQETPPAAPAAPPPPAAPAAPSLRQRQLAAAVPPKGDGGQPPAPAEEDDFNAGFNKYHRSR